MPDDKTTEERIQALHDEIKRIWPDATSIRIFVNCDGIEAEPTYRTNAVNFSMRNVSGGWIRRASM